MELRNAFVRWLSEPKWSHAMTFAYNRSVRLARAKEIFGQFCIEVDRLKFGKRKVHLIASSDRFQAIGCFEHIETNIHLHAAVQLDVWLDHPPSEADFTNYQNLWEKCTRGAGDLLCERIGSATGWARYISKESYANEYEYTLSSDFHPDSKPKRN